MGRFGAGEYLSDVAVEDSNRASLLEAIHPRGNGARDNGSLNADKLKILFHKRFVAGIYK